MEMNMNALDEPLNCPFVGVYERAFSPHVERRKHGLSVPDSSRTEYWWAPYEPNLMLGSCSNVCKYSDEEDERVEYLINATSTQSYYCTSSVTLLSPCRR